MNHSGVAFQFDHARLRGRGVDFEEDVFGLGDDGFVSGSERGEKGGDVGGVDSVSYVEGQGGAGVWHFG
jgi:hypothetical protein